MSVPRPVLLAVLGLALIVATLLATRGSGSSGTITPVPTPASKPAPARPAPVRQAKVPAHAAKPSAPPVARPAQTPPAAGSGTAAKVAAAYQRGNVVVLFFTHPGSADDAADETAIDSIAQIRHVSAFSVGLSDVTTFRPLLTNVGVAQTPSIVVLRSGMQARLVEGFVDPQSLRQTIYDFHR